MTISTSSEILETATIYEDADIATHFYQVYNQRMEALDEEWRVFLDSLEKTKAD